MRPPLYQRALAEVAGTALLVGIGTGTIAAAARVGGIPQLWMAAAWFLAVAVPIFLLGRVSGAHLNPVVTLGLAASRRFPWRELPTYVGAQLLGAFAASSSVLLALGDVAHLGATLPAGDDLARTFVLELAFTFLLVLSVLWLTHERKTAHPLDILAPPAVVGISTYLIGPLTGSSLNPARTLAPGILSGDLLGIWVYLIAVPAGSLAAVLAVRLWNAGRTRSVERARRT